MLRYCMVLALLLGASANLIISRNNFVNKTIQGARGFIDFDDGVLIQSRNLQFDHRQIKIKRVKTCPVCKCGLATKNRIVGGEAVVYNKYTWMAALTYFARYYCVASLINDRYVATAGHCTNGFQRKNIQVHFLNYARVKSSPLQRNVDKVINFNGYNPATLNNDISLLKLSSPVPLGENLRPICLPDMAISLAGQEAMVAGWGARSQHGKPSEMLHEVKVPIMTNKRCRKTAYGGRITRNMICAGYIQGGKDACQGDSGGPLMVVNESVHVLAGIVSWGAGCAAKNKPGVYTRVTRYAKWIDENTEDACYCES